jgi:hypothetical protein
MRRVILLSCTLIAAACGPREQAAEEQPAATPAIALADVAGSWTMHAMNAAGDSTLVTAQMVATAAMDGWTYTFAGRDPVPMRVLSVDGDSIVTEMGPYASALREGVNVTTRSVLRLQNGELVGTFAAHYATSTPDSLLLGRMHGVRAP